MEIGVPTRFSTPRADIDVVTRAARAPAILVEYPGKSGDQLNAELALQTGVRTIDRRIYPSVIEGPFIGHDLDNDGPLAARAGVRYFIHSVHIAASNTAAQAGSFAGITFTQGGVAKYFRVLLVPSAANAQNSAVVLDCLCDVDTAVLAWSDAGTPRCFITYAMVGGV